jgi:zinc/manganese transport system permease protein
MIWDSIIAPFADYSFMQRALLGCIAVSFGATPIGVFLMLRRMSLMGDAMAHAILPGAAVGYLIAGLSVGAMTVGGMVAGIAVALASVWVTRNTELKEDASLAAFYLISLALGVAIISIKGSAVDLLHVLFGSVLALDNATLYLLVSTSSLSLCALAFLYRPLVLESVDPLFLRSVRGDGGWAHYGFLILVVMNLVAGFHALGTLMAVGVMLLPPASARFWVRRVEGLLGLSVLLAAAASAMGLLLSYHFGFPSGPAVILLAGVIYAISVIFGPVGGAVKWGRKRPHLKG